MINADKRRTSPAQAYSPVESDTVYYVATIACAMLQSNLLLNQDFDIDLNLDVRCNEQFLPAGIRLSVTENDI